MRLYMIEHKTVNWLVIFIKKELNEQKASLINNNVETDGIEKAEKVVDQIGSFNPYLMVSSVLHDYPPCICFN